MSRFLLLTTTDCHLCEHARDVLGELGIAWREVGSASKEGIQLAVIAPPIRPVLFTAQGQVLAYGRLSLKRLRRQLDLQGAPT